MKTLPFFAFLLLAAACLPEAAEWSETDHRAIYAGALEALREESGRESLVVDPRPRFLVDEDEAGLYRMGEPNRYGDPGFSAVIRRLPAVSECDLLREGLCDPGSTRAFVALSGFASSTRVAEGGARAGADPPSPAAELGAVNT